MYSRYYKFKTVLYFKFYKMLRGCPRKSRAFNFLPQNQEGELAHSSSSSPVLENIVINDEDQSTSVMCPSRSLKVRCIQKISILQRMVLSEEKEIMQQRAALRIANESLEQMEHRLADLRNRATQRLST